MDVTYRPQRIVPLARKIRAEVIPPSKSFARFLAITMHKPGDTKAEREEYWDAVRGTLIDALAEHKQAQAGDPTAFHLQPEITDFIAEALLDLRNGEMTPLFQRRNVGGGLGNRKTRSCQRQIDRAVDYISAADLGIVADEKARSTVAESFGVSRQNVYRWVKAAGSVEQRDRRLSEKYRDIEERSKNNAVPSIIIKLMKMAAEDYRLRRATRIA